MICYICHFTSYLLNISLQIPIYGNLPIRGSPHPSPPHTTQMTVVVNMFPFSMFVAIFVKTPNRHEMQLHAEK